MSITLPSKLFSFALISTSIALTGCQPSESEKTDPENHEHSEAEEYAHDEHDDHDEHEHEHDEHDDHEHDEHAHDHHDHDHDHNRIEFDCEPDISLGAFYHTDTTPKTAHILIDGIEYDLTQASWLPGEVYISNLGLDDNHGIAWQVEGKEGDLFSIPTELAQAEAIKDIDTLHKQNRLYHCHQDS